MVYIVHTVHRFTDLFSQLQEVILYDSYQKKVKKKICPVKQIYRYFPELIYRFTRFTNHIARRLKNFEFVE